MAVAVLVLTGTVGVGKTTILREIGEVLRLADVAHARIDLDWLSYAQTPSDADPDTTTFGRYGADLAIRNLAAVWPNYAALGIRRLAVARAVETPKLLDGIASAVPNSTITTCRLVAPAQVVEQRVVDREKGLARPFLLRMARELADQPSPISHFEVINGSDRTVTEVANEVLQRADWLIEV